MEKCRPPLDYAKYVDKLKRYSEEMSIEAASVRTVDKSGGIGHDADRI